MHGSSGTPRWVKVFGIVVLILALLFLAMHLLGYNPGGHKFSALISEHGVRQP